MKLEVGIYVRIKNKVGYCVIGKIENINDYREPMAKYCVDIQGNDFIFVPEEMIIKASNNIIDLIEVGDYVNGRKVSKINLDRTFNKEKCILCADTDYDCLETIYKNEDIKSIVTKEQFESIKYSLEG